MNHIPSKFHDICDQIIESFNKNNLDGIWKKYKEFFDYLKGPELDRAAFSLWGNSFIYGNIKENFFSKEEKEEYIGFYGEEEDDSILSFFKTRIGERFDRLECLMPLSIPIENQNKEKIFICGQYSDMGPHGWVIDWNGLFKDEQAFLSFLDDSVTWEDEVYSLTDDEILKLWKDK